MLIGVRLNIIGEVNNLIMESHNRVSDGECMRRHPWVGLLRGYRFFVCEFDIRDHVLIHESYYYTLFIDNFNFKYHSIYTSIRLDFILQIRYFLLKLSYYLLQLSWLFRQI